MRDWVPGRLLVAEFVGTFTLVFAGCGAIMVDAKTHALGHVGVAISFGLVIMTMIYAVGHISGAHFNPAVTFAFALSRHFPWRRAAGYWAAQLTGAVGAAAVLRGSLGNIAHVGAIKNYKPFNRSEIIQRNAYAPTQPTRFVYLPEPAK